MSASQKTCNSFFDLTADLTSKGVENFLFLHVSASSLLCRQIQKSRFHHLCLNAELIQGSEPIFYIRGWSQCNYWSKLFAIFGKTGASSWRKHFLLLEVRQSNRRIRGPFNLNRRCVFRITRAKLIGTLMKSDEMPFTRYSFTKILHLLTTSSVKQ